MGWKISVAATPELGSLEEVIAEAYGPEWLLQSTGQRAEEIMLASDPKAMTYADHHWLFDWAAVPGWINGDAPSHRDWSAFMLHEGSGTYGFAVHRAGTTLRKRIAGADDMGIMVEAGDLLPEEEALLQEMAGSDPEAACAAWRHEDATVYLPSLQLEATHDVLSTDMVFGLMAGLTGIRMDRDEGWPETPVFSLVKPEAPPVRRPSLLGRLFGRAR